MMHVNRFPHILFSFLKEYVDVLATSLPNIAESSESDSASGNRENNGESISCSKNAQV